MKSRGSRPSLSFCLLRAALRMWPFQSPLRERFGSWIGIVECTTRLAAKHRPRATLFGSTTEDAASTCRDTGWRGFLKISCETQSLSIVSRVKRCLYEIDRDFEATHAFDGIASAGHERGRSTARIYPLPLRSPRPRDPIAWFETALTLSAARFAKTISTTIFSSESGAFRWDRRSAPQPSPDTTYRQWVATRERGRDFYGAPREHPSCVRNLARAEKLRPESSPRSSVRA